MTSPASLLSILLELWTLTGVVLILHWRSARRGLTALYVFMGGLAAALQLQGLAAFEASQWPLTTSAYTLLPALLLCFLLIYVTHGALHARGSLAGVALVILVVALSQQLLTAHPALPWSATPPPPPAGLPPWIWLAPLASILTAFVLLAVIYQLMSNLRSRFPSRLAASSALFAALWSNALVFPSSVSWGDPAVHGRLVSHLAGGTLAGLALLPGLVLYFHHLASRFPDSAATTPHPALDFFVPTQQIENQVRYHYSLLRTLSAINQLILRSTNPSKLLQSACELLVDNRKYHLVWIVLVRDDGQPGEEILQAGVTCPEAELCLQDHSSLFYTVTRSGENVIINELSVGEGVSWRQKALARGYQTMAAFPMRYAHQILGTLNVCLPEPHGLDPSEIELLQELADDLAYALSSLQAREQQVILQTAAETMRDGLIISSLKGDILYANSIVAQIAGRSVEELQGMTTRDLLSADQTTGFVSILKTLLREESTSLEVIYEPPNRKPITVSINASLVRDDRGRPVYLVSNVRDVTQQRRYEHQLLSLNQLTADLIQIHDTQVMLASILEFGEELLGSDAGCIFLSNPERKSVRESLSHNLPGEFPPSPLWDMTVSALEEASQPSEPLFIPDTSAYPGFDSLAAALINSVLLLPVQFKDDLVGVLSLYYYHPPRLREGELQLGKTLAQTLAILLQNALLHQAEQEQQRWKEALIHAAAAINSTLDLDAVLDQILNQVMQVVPCRAANLQVIEHGRVWVIRTRGYEDFPGALEAFETSPSLDKIATFQQLAATRSPILIPDTSQDERWVQMPGTEWVACYAGIPLVVDEEVIGALQADGDQPYSITETMMDYLVTFAAHASTAIKNARLYAATARRAEELATLVTATAIVSSSLNFKEVLSLVAEEMTRILDIQACVISDYEPETGALSLLTAFTPAGWKGRELWPSSCDPAQFPQIHKVLESQSPLQMRFRDPALSQVQRQRMQRVGVKTLLMIPLVIQDRTIGLVELMDHTRERTFTSHEISLGQTLASHAAIAMQNAHLYQQLQQHASELETHVEHRTAQLRAAKERIEVILTSVPDPVFVLDQDNRLIQANQEGEILLAYAQETNQDLFSPQFIHTLETEESAIHQAVVEIHGRAYQARSSPVVLGENRPMGQVIVFRDVTRFRELDQMKSKFVSDVSHELRTPLTNLTLYLTLMETTEDHSRQKHYLRILQRETDRLTHLIEDLLTISRIEVGKIGGQIRPLNVNDLIRELAQDRAFLATQNEIELQFVSHPQLLYAYADTKWLTQAVSNLLTNAVNYTPPGGNITLSTGLQSREGQHWVVIQVEDTGVGIAPDEIPRLFERFFRGEASRQTGADGTGLGLSISKELVARMGGDITVESQPGEGSTFTIWLRPTSSAML